MNNINGLVIEPTGRMEIISLADFEKRVPFYDEGYPNIISNLPYSTMMLISDCNETEENDIANKIYYDENSFGNYKIKGDIFICGSRDLEPTSLDKSQLNELFNMIRRVNKWNIF